MILAGVSGVTSHEGNDAHSDVTQISIFRIESSRSASDVSSPLTDCEPFTWLTGVPSPSPERAGAAARSLGWI